MSPADVCRLIAVTLSAALIADLFCPRNAHQPVCMHEAYWRDRLEKS